MGGARPRRPISRRAPCSTSSSRRPAKADCNPLWTATAALAAHVAEARRQVRRCESKANGSSL
ncbi:hypothetical protein D3869_14535 (plasmid) [Azospirillum brasilense]|uniref:Uncharacterized protein n=1 Tax=Azospirillum brasilense TaxID=192 RepID=A0A4D8R1J2_AZOBR|nr:hypothetical protein D3869_14535 [Azospirillum brasilense]